MLFLRLLLIPAVYYDPCLCQVLVGPDTGYRDAQDWLELYLPPVASVLHAVTHHVYDGPGRR